MRNNPRTKLIHADDACNKTQQLLCIFQFKMWLALPNTTAWTERSSLSLEDNLIYLQHGHSIKKKKLDFFT